MSSAKWRLFCLGLNVLTHNKASAHESRLYMYLYYCNPDYLLHIQRNSAVSRNAFIWGLFVKWFLCVTWMCGCLTHWGRVMHICVSKLTTIGSDNGLSPGRRQAIIRTSAGILLIEPLGTNFNEILIEIHTFSFKKIHFKMSGKWPPFRLGLNVLTNVIKNDKVNSICDKSWSLCLIEIQKLVLLYAVSWQHNLMVRFDPYFLWWMGKNFGRKLSWYQKSK